jgi:sec-independent protein translocase protein TatB
MNILGVGPFELILVLIIMLVVAGPKRMVQWAYEIGRYTAQLRAMFQETMNAVQKELSESGLDVRKDIPQMTKSFDIVSEAARVINTEVSSATTAINAPPSTPSTTAPAATPGAPSTGETPAASSTETPSDNGTPPAGTETRTDDEKPRYDSWLPN